MATIPGLCHTPHTQSAESDDHTPLTHVTLHALFQRRKAGWPEDTLGNRLSAIRGGRSSTTGKLLGPLDGSIEMIYWKHSILLHSVAVDIIQASADNQPYRYHITQSKHAVIFAEALAETALETTCILAFVSATSYISDLIATKELAEVTKLTVWVATVFLSGAATAGPRRWLETSQLFNIDNPISEEW